jgi:hypothetical protein
VLRRTSRQAGCRCGKASPGWRNRAGGSGPQKWQIAPFLVGLQGLEMSYRVVILRRQAHPWDKAGVAVRQEACGQAEGTC